MVELVERLGHTFDWWLEQPLAFHRWCFGHLQELDRRRGWLERARSIDSAYLAARAFHDPESLKSEQQSHLAAAAAADADEIAIDRGRQLLAELEAARMFDDLPMQGALGQSTG